MTRLDSGKLSEALDHVERELSALWAPQDPPKARVCMANLVVLCGASSFDQALELTDALHAADAARTFVVAVDPMLPLWSIDASVSARCQRDGDRLLCAERVELRLGAGATGRAASMLASLSMPEVPTEVVLLDPAPAPLVAALSREASRLIVDSEALGVEAAAGVAAGTAAHLVDLAWMRLYPFRNAIAGAFDPPAVRPAVSAIHRLAVEAAAAPSGPTPASARLLLGWLVSRLGWRLSASGAVNARHQSIAVHLTSTPTPDAPPGRLLSVELSALLGEAHVLIDLAREPHGSTLQVVRTTEGLGSQVDHFTLVEPPLAHLVDRALQDNTPDAALRQALLAASAPASP